MSRSQNVTVLDIGSEKLTFMQAARGVNDNVVVKKYAAEDYSGYADGEFLNSQELPSKVEDVFVQAGINKKNVPDTLYIGVPGEFTTVVCKEVKIDFGRPHRITADDIDAIFAEGDTFSNDARFTLVNISAIYYVTDDNRRMIQPVGLVTTMLKAMISYVLCEKRFTTLFDRISYDLRVNNVEYISSIWAEADCLFDSETRDKSVLFADIGHISTTVALIRGDGLLHMLSFSCGGGMFAADLNMHMDIPYADADIIKRKADLSRNYSDGDVYTVTTADGERSYSAEQVNEIIGARIEAIGAMINKAIAKCEYETPQYMSLNITGGGLANIRGASKLLSKAVGRPVKVFAPWFASFAKPEMSSTAAVICVALKNSKHKRTSLGAWFRRWLYR